MALHGGILHAQPRDVESVVNLKVIYCLGGIDGIECGLCVAQRQVERTGLQHVAWMLWRKAQRHAAIHYIFAQSHCYLANAVFGALFIHRIIVKRASHARERWIVISFVILTHHFLYDYRHLLLVDNVAGGCHIRLAVGEEHRGIHALDGIAELLEHSALIGEMRYHIGGIDARKWLIMAVFEQTR